MEEKSANVYNESAELLQPDGKKKKKPNRFSLFLSGNAMNCPQNGRRKQQTVHELQRHKPNQPPKQSNAKGNRTNISTITEELLAE